MLRRVLITLDAVGGVWRYALDVARGLEAHGVDCLLAGFGPAPDSGQRAECGRTELVWTDEPLDWMVAESVELDRGSEVLAGLAADWRADVLHLNLPSQACGLVGEWPVVVASHSCVPTWWRAVQGTSLPAEWAWQVGRNRAGFNRADAVVVPSRSHAEAVEAVYGAVPRLRVIPNAVGVDAAEDVKEPMVLSAGRWWDPGKNGAVLDDAAAGVAWPVVLAGPLDGPSGQQVAFRHVRPLGPLPHRDVLALMRRAAIFAAPSRYEPFGLAVVEAALSGAALVLADIPTFRELWDGAAVFVPAEDSGGWARALAALADDPDARRRLAAEAGVRARGFTLGRQSAALFGLYSGLMAVAA